MECRKCKNKDTLRIRGFSGWDFFIECDCGNIDHYACADMQAQEGNGPTEHLISEGEEALYDYKINKKCFELEKAEEGWKNINFSAYAKYDRITHTAKNLLKDERTKI